MIIDAIFLALGTLLWLIPVIVIGIVLAELVVELKLVRALGFLMLPIIETAIVLVAGRLLLPKRDDYTKIEKEQRPPLKEALKTSVKNSGKMMRRILLIIIPCIVIVFVLMDIGVFELLETYLSSVAAYFPIPAEGLPIIAAQFAEPVAAYTIAGSLLSQNILDARDVVLTLLIGDLLATITILRFIIPYYLGVFGPKLGTQIMTLATSLRLGVVVLIIVVLALRW